MGGGSKEQCLLALHLALQKKTLHSLKATQRLNGYSESPAGKQDCGLSGQSSPMIFDLQKGFY